MKIVYYTSGITGSGRIVKGLSIANALKRKKVPGDFTILSSSPFAAMADRLSVSHEEIALEDITALDRDNYRNSILYNTLLRLNPNIILIDLLWFPLYFFADALPFKKVYLWQRLGPDYYNIKLEDQTISYNPDIFDQVVAIEPFTGKGPAFKVNPLIIRNRDEILPRRAAEKKLGLDPDKEHALIAYNGNPGDFERIKKKYDYLESADYEMVYSTNYKGGIFPVVDYFNAFDFIVCGCGYSAFWETRYFQKEAAYEPNDTLFMDTRRIMNDYLDYSFEENGADQLVDILLNI